MNVLFLGDSLIEYFDWQERFPEHRVFNLGSAGEPVEGLLSRIVRVKEVCPKADMIFIMSGINNVAMGDVGFIDFYKIALEKLSSFYPDARIFIHSLLPTLVDFIADASITTANEYIRNLAKDSGLEYLDVHSVFTDTKGRPIREYLLDDGVHLSRTGYDVWAKVVEDTLLKHA